MFKLNGILAGIFLASLLIGSSVGARSITLEDGATSPKAEPSAVQAGQVTEIPFPPPANVLGYYTSDGGKTWTPIKEEEGVAERVPSGTTQEEFIGAQSTTP